MKPSDAIGIIKGLIKTVEISYKSSPLLDKPPYPAVEALTLAISALEKQEQDRWRPCNEKSEYDFQNVLVRWRDKRKGCEKDYYIFEGYVVRGIWCGLFEDADISDFEPIEWKPLEPYMEDES